MIGNITIISLSSVYVMRKKREINSSELALNTTENLLDPLLSDAAENLAEGFLKAIPFGGSVVAIGKAIANMKDARYTKQLFEFFHESEDTKKFAQKFFKDKTNVAIGIEILSLVERTYLAKQARMIARAFRLWKEEKVFDKELFDDYVSVIMTFDNHLIREFENLMQTLPNTLLSNSNLTFVMHGFIKEQESTHSIIDGVRQTTGKYYKTERAYHFYDYIFRDDLEEEEQCTQ